MNKKGYKRIIGLFIFTLTIALLGIIDVHADEKICDKVSNETLLQRYGFKIDYVETANGGKYVIQSEFNAADAAKLFDSFDKSKIKFKISKLYFYQPYDLKLDDQGKPIPSDITDADNIKNLDKDYVEQYEGTLDSLVGGTIEKLRFGRKDSIDVNKNIFDKRKDDNNIGLAFRIEPADGFNDPEVIEKCGPNSTFFAIVYVAYENGEDAEPETVDDGIVVGSNYQSKWLDCKGYQNFDKNSFAYKFCADKDASVGIDGDQKKNGTRKFTITKDDGVILKYEDIDKKNPYKPGNVFGYKCDYTVSENGNNSSEYYTNKNYLYGKGSFEFSEDYEYHGEYTKTKKTATCTITCEEVVKVEYGPPVASKAGLCFEYKVKVTSRVNCQGEGPNKPPTQKVCTPTPSCKHKGGKVWPIAGPNDDFDECVQSCDGGVYSDRCVNKCYKKVYGTSIIRQTTGTEIAYGDNITDTSVTGVVFKDAPYSYVLDGSTIKWDVNNNYERKSSKTTGGTNQGWDHIKSGDSYWHRRHRWGINASTYNNYTEEGIPEKIGCDQTSCKWTANTKGDCGDSKYLRYYNHPNVYKIKYTDSKTNQTHTRKDKKDYTYDPNDPNKNKVVYDRYTYDKYKNKEIYDRLSAKCKAYAACNTTTSEFTISVEYTEKGKETTTTKINFPYTENNDENSKDAITHNDNDSISCPTNANSIILKSRGCYNCGGAGANITENEGEDGLKKMYMTEWSFPGTWIHNKTGKISYKPITDGTWRKIKEKFCLPLNAGNVNAKWYNYYQYQTKGNDTSYTYYNPDYIKNVECPDGTTVQTKCGSDNIVPTDDDIKYNIKATARKFGLFEWDIDIKCFYAVNDIFPKEKESDTCSLTCGSTEKYRVRSVDLKNLFPDKNGTELNDLSTTGRTPGFNWSTYANQTNKDVDYTSAPSNYAKWIQFQAANGGIYNDEYLDYEVTLTKEIINDIKQDFKSDRSYISWKGNIVNTDDEASANSYRSPLFEQGGLLAGDSVYPNGEALKCNNIGAHTKSSNYSAVCAEFNNSGKEGK